MAQDCWQILGLDRATTTERDVKAAYARLLKQHRPDVDPPGFQRVREAYLAALAQLRTGNVETASVREIAELPPDEPPPPREIPERTRNAFAALRDSLHRGSESESLLQVQAACFSDHVSEDERQRELFDVYREDWNRLALAVTERFVIGDLRCGWTHMAQWIIGRWHESQSVERLSVLAAAVIQRKDLAVDGEIVDVLVRCGGVLAFWNPVLASQLMDRVYPTAAAGERRRITRQVEPAVALGQMFDGLPDDDLKFWWNVLHRQEFDAEWKSRMASQRVSRLIRVRGLRWAGHVQLMRMMGAENAVGYAAHFKSFRRKLEAIVDIMLAALGLHKYSHFYGTENRYEVFAGAVIVLFVLLAFLVVFLISIFS